ncbi:hypothetical protein IHQ71_11385 [Rhizobium sp. TH2]|uniref:hypothetical protein n=1 Tax=Rhizobium sp. TH2 TaxID=2775403 RepID=UPI0021570A14|nr:hypothetical protein [Rhizobium sp. TH2]UVC11120.1 hypothetical protein IHQ71_11385 [Rhizobium sp. TH2]
MNEIAMLENLTDEEWFALPEETRFAQYLPLMHAACTDLQNWRHCRLPRCRRARACNGAAKLHRPYEGFPPCSIGNDEHGRLLEAMHRWADAVLEGDQG